MLSIFRRNKPTAATPTQDPRLPAGAYRFASGSTLLEPHGLLIRNIRNDVGAATEFFDRYYLPCLQAYAELVQSRPYGQEGGYRHAGGAIDVAIKRTAMALKLRLGLLLPSNVPAEELTQRQECWTYGVFVSALFKDLGGILANTALIGFTQQDRIQAEWDGVTDSIDRYAHYRMKTDPSVTQPLSRIATLLYLPHIIPPHGMKWLKTDNRLLQELLASLSGEYPDSSNMIAHLVMKAARESLSGTKLIFTVKDEKKETQRAAVNEQQPAELEPAIEPPEPDERSTAEPIVTDNEPSPPAEQVPHPTDEPAPQPVATELVEKTAQPTNPPEKDQPTPPHEQKADPIEEQKHDPKPEPAQDAQSSEQPRSTQPKKTSKQENKKTKQPSASAKKPRRSRKKKVEATDFIETVQNDLQMGLFDDEGGVIEKNEDLHIEYPAAFRRYTESPSNLLDDLKMQGKVIKEVRGEGRTRTIIFKKP